MLSLLISVFSTQSATLQPGTYSGDDGTSITFYDDQFPVEGFHMVNGTKYEFKSIGGTADLVIPALNANCKGAAYQKYTERSTISFLPFLTPAEFDNNTQHSGTTIVVGKEKFVPLFQKEGNKCVSPLFSPPMTHGVHTFVSITYDFMKQEAYVHSEDYNITGQQKSGLFIPHTNKIVTLKAGSSGPPVLLFGSIGVVVLLVGAALAYILTKKGSKTESSSSTSKKAPRAVE